MQSTASHPGQQQLIGKASKVGQHTVLCKALKDFQIHPIEALGNMIEQVAYLIVTGIVSTPNSVQALLCPLFVADALYSRNDGDCVKKTPKAPKRHPDA